MKTYILTSEEFTGEIEFRYNDAGQLVGYDNRADFYARQHAAYAYINAYMGRIACGTQPKHAETYLNSELWNG
ncbi:MAG: hypothetical protein LBL04_14030 [Bacteroidales bacterium]|jgi:hypothetical protein|nr:hypothetical protein [Bacteroidales bacterium]